MSFTMKLTGVMMMMMAVAANEVAAAKPLWHQLSGYTFEQYANDFGKQYESKLELARRSDIFHQKLAAVQAHNSQVPTPSWKRGINHLSDRTPDELSAMKGLNKPLLYSQKAERDETETVSVSPADAKALPEIVDWRTVPGVMTAVKNQGQCGSCWTFASTETLESQWAIHTGILQDLSEQFVLDCTPNPLECGGTGGCMGGTAELAYARLEVTGGIPSEYTYPYISGVNGTAEGCRGTFPLKPEVPHSGGELAAATVAGFVNVLSNDFAAVQTAVATVGPLAISVDAGDWHDYETGIYAGGNMTNPDLDHLVQLVGYGSDKEGEYWIVRNSWTPSWGENGFIRLDTTQACGEDITPLDGNGCKNGPSSVKVCGQSGMLFDAIYPLIGAHPTKVEVA